LVLCKRFGIPSYGIGRLSDCPWSAAVTLIVECAVVSPAGFLRRRVKADVTDVGAQPKRDTEGLNGAVQVLVVQGVLVVPNLRTWVCYFVRHKPDAIVSRVRLKRGQHGTRI